MDKGLMVVQANAFTESRQHYTLNEKRLLQTLIASVKPEDVEFREYKISIKEFAQMANIDESNMYKYAEDMADSIMKKPVKIKSSDEFVIFHLVNRAHYKEGVLTLKLSEETFHIFLALKDTGHYTTYELAEFMTLRSVYAQRIYELLKQNENTWEKERIIPLSELREMLGIEENEYKLFGNFKKTVLNQAHKHIIADTELRYEWEPIKPSRRVEGIRFFNITSNKKPDKSDPLPKFKAWFFKEFKGYTGLLYEFYEGHIFLNEKGYFYDGRDKKRRFEEDEIERIWQQLLDRREDLKARKEVWEAWKVQQKMLKEAPLPFIDTIKDDSIEIEPISTKEQITAPITEQNLDPQKEDPSSSWLGRFLQKMKG